jgi:integrase
VRGHGDEIVNELGHHATSRPSARLRGSGGTIRVVPMVPRSWGIVLMGYISNPGWRAVASRRVHKYHWLPTLARLGLRRVRLYNARHSCTSMLLEAAVPMRVAQEMLGHASMVLTAETYPHVTPTLKRRQRSRSPPDSPRGSPDPATRISGAAL